MSTMPQGDQENFVCPHAPVNISRTFGDWERLGPPTLNANIPVRYDIHKPDYEAAYHKLARYISIAWTHLNNGNVGDCKRVFKLCSEMIEDVEAPKTVLDTETR